MSNQHTKNGIEIIIQKCADPDCNNQVRLTPSKIKKGAKYCSIACCTKQPRKFKDKEIKYILENMDKMTRTELAKKLGTTRNSLMHILGSLRSKGYAIPLTPQGRKPYKLQLKQTTLKTIPMTKVTPDHPDGRSQRKDPGSATHRDRKPSVSEAQ